MPGKDYGTPRVRTSYDPRRMSSPRGSLYFFTFFYLLKIVSCLTRRLREHCVTHRIILGPPRKYVMRFCIQCYALFKCRSTKLPFLTFRKRKRETMSQDSLLLSHLNYSPKMYVNVHIIIQFIFKASSYEKNKKYLVNNVINKIIINSLLNSKNIIALQYKILQKNVRFTGKKVQCSFFQVNFLKMIRF